MNCSKEMDKEVIVLCLKDFRLMLKLNQKQMAEKIGVSASYYYKLESGSLTPSYQFMRKLKDRFPKVCIDEMFFK